MLAIDSSPFGHPRAEARTQTSLCCSVSPAAVRSKRTTPKHVLRSEGRSERGTDSFPFGISFRFGMECLAHSGVGGDASRTTRPFTLCLGLLSARSHRQHTTKPVTRGVQNTLLSFPVIFSFSLKGWFLWQ